MLNFNNFPLTKSYAAIFILAHTHAQLCRHRCLNAIFSFFLSSGFFAIVDRFFLYSSPNSFKNVRKWASKRSVECAYEYILWAILDENCIRLWLWSEKTNKRTREVNTMNATTTTWQKNQRRIFFSDSVNPMSFFGKNLKNNTFKSAYVKPNKLFNTHFLV